MEEISVKGKKYVKAKLVARELGYTNDYIGQLCRSGKVAAELVGRTWYVDPQSAREHKGTRYRSARATSKRVLQGELLRKLRDQDGDAKENFYDAHTIKPHAKLLSYEPDETELLPMVKRRGQEPVAVLPVELADAKKVSIETQTDKHYHFEAPVREETKFFGTLRVTDFLTEVPVAGIDERAHSVPVKGKVEKEKPKVRSAAYHVHLDTVHDTFNVQPIGPLKKPQPNFTAEHPAHEIPVVADEEVVTLPIIYRVAVVGAFAVALLVATAVVGLEASILATAETSNVEYAFAVENLSALVFGLE